MSEQRTVKRARVKHELSLEERLLQAAREARDTACRLPEGKKRALLLRSARESEAAAGINAWLSSAGSKPAK